MSETYVSPLLSRLKDEETLTLENLAYYVPIAQAGRAAETKLREEGATDRTEERELRKAVREGERAKEKLVLMALPLIKSLAHKEYRRRQAWGSRITFEDIVSEGLGGFIRGIYAYNPEGNHKSATNYLGQWIITDMKRNVEELDHDFSVPYEAIERQRKIRAIRSRLTSELGREPTDQEIIDDAAKGMPYGDSMLGKVDKSQAAGSRRRVITQKHIDEERDMFRRTGAVLPSEQLMSDTDGSSMSTLEALSAKSITANDSNRAWTHEANDAPASVEAVEDREVKERLSQLIEQAFDLIGVGRVQREVIRRRFGLMPYEEEQKVRDIALHTRVPKHKVSRIVTLFAAEMSNPGGAFHKLVSEMGEDDADSLGMGWIISQLGEYTGPSNKKTHKDLTSNLAEDKNAPTAPRVHMSTAHDGVLATFHCPQERRDFTHNYVSEEQAPITAHCPYCGAASPRV